MSEGVLFVHNNFPGQFRDLAQALIARGVRCWAIGQAHAPGLPGMGMARYQLTRGSTPGLLPAAVRAEADLLRAADAFRVAKALKEHGCDPAVIVAHPGWGESLHLREAFPDARQVLFAEFFYHGRGFDVGFDPEFPEPTEAEVQRVNAKGLSMAWAYAHADAIVAPTPFQASTLPPVFRERAHIIHEGVDVASLRPSWELGPPEPFELPDGRRLAPGTPIVTHVNRSLEPARGIHTFARALPRLLAEVPDAHAIVIGEAKTSGYGAAAPDGRTWKDWAFDGLDLDHSRVHFVGKLPHARMHHAMRLGAAHVYYTIPFVLSWSLSEAMALGCNIIASDTGPVRDAIEDGVSGRLLPFTDHHALSEALIHACRHPQQSEPLRRAARARAEALFDREKGRKAWFALLREQGLVIPEAAA